MARGVNTADGIRDRPAASLTLDNFARTTLVRGMRLWLFPA